MADPQALNSEVRRKIMGYVVSQAVFAVTRLGIVDGLADGPREVTRLAKESAVDEQALLRFLRVLAAEGLLTEDPAGTFGLTPAGELLRADVPGSLRHLCELMDGEAYQVWARSSHSLRTGEPAFAEVFGEPYFDWIAARPEAAAAFNRAQAGLVTLRMAPLLDRDWRDTTTVVDIGGGNGELLTELLRRHRHLRGVVFEMPHVVAGRTGTGRLEWVGGDFFAEIPVRGDTYVLAQILHDWPDDRAVEILRHCRRAMPAEGRLLIVEQVLPNGAAPHPGRLLDLHMLVLLGGRERTEADWRALLADGGFMLTGITEGERSAVLEARPNT